MQLQASAVRARWATTGRRLQNHDTFNQRTYACKHETIDGRICAYKLRENN